MRGGSHIREIEGISPGLEQIHAQAIDGQHRPLRLGRLGRGRMARRRRGTALRCLSGTQRAKSHRARQKGRKQRGNQESVNRDPHACHYKP